MRATAILLLLTAGCHATAPAPGADTPGDRLERSARDRGLIVDPSRVEAVGLYARDEDRICVVPDGKAFRIGALVRYEDGPGCEAAGTAERAGSNLLVRFDDACRFTATIDGDHLAFPAELPGACDRFCSGRASLAALAGDRLSSAMSEAAALRGASGRALCGG